jgi:hypothetical protein
VFYLYMEALRAKLTRRRPRAVQATEELEELPVPVAEPSCARASRT